MMLGGSQVEKRLQAKKGFARLLELAGERRGMLIVAGILSSFSAICMLVPYLSVYAIMKELLDHAADPVSADKGLVLRWGAIALIGLVGGLALLYAGGIASHIAAFRILYGLRVKLASHIGRLPLGWLNGTSTGAVKKTLEQNVEKVETFVAHQWSGLQRWGGTTSCSRKTACTPSCGGSSKKQAVGACRPGPDKR
jgi:ATP-binding cassette subfamily B protein